MRSFIDFILVKIFLFMSEVFNNLASLALSIASYFNSEAKDVIYRNIK